MGLGELNFVNKAIARMPCSVRQVADKRLFNHRNLTLRKAVSFSLISAVGGAVLIGITWAMTEWGGQWYILSAFIGGVVSVAVKFVLNGLFTYPGEK